MEKHNMVNLEVEFPQSLLAVECILLRKLMLTIVTNTM